MCKKLATEFLGHILRMPDGEAVRLCAIYTPHHGTKNTTYIIPKGLLGVSECIVPARPNNSGPQQSKETTSRLVRGRLMMMGT